ncbi:MAG: hypothetical protein IPK83_03970 [Planctomycetes bacterium]|nr:hypothetical protein [Planctomycetota bacterium]
MIHPFGDIRAVSNVPSNDDMPLSMPDWKPSGSRGKTDARSIASRHQR